MNALLQEQVRRRRTATTGRQRLEQELQEALAEMDRIREAIRRGLISDLTQQMLLEAEARVRTLRAQLTQPTKAQLHAIRVLPQLVRDRLDELDQALQRSDVAKARAFLRGMVGEILLRPTPEGLEGELRGNLKGLLALSKQALVSVTLVAGGGFEPLTFGL